MINPFLDKSLDTNWPALTPEYVVPAMTEVLEQAAERLQEICSQDASLASYDSTFGALEDLQLELGRPWGKVCTLLSVCNTPELRKAHADVLPKVTEFYTRIPLNQDLWRVLKAFSTSQAASTVSAVQARYMEETINDFSDAGADLPADKKRTLEHLQTELAELTRQFSDNLLDATNAYELIVDDEARLSGLPEHAKAQARAAAQEKGYGSEKAPQWLFTLHAPSMIPVLTYADDEKLREDIWKAYHSLGREKPHDNRELLQTIVHLRADKAELLGAANFADLVLKRRMARSGQQALAFVNDLVEKTQHKFKQQNAELEHFKAQKTGQAPGPLAPWEVGYWTEKLRRERFDFDEEALRPYFALDRVIHGLFTLTERVFGFRVVPTQGPTWHPQVKLFELHDGDGSLLGKFATDWHPRASKRGGAWMADLHTGLRTADKHEPHLGYIAGNMTPPNGDTPALLTHREVETIFHEFGHLIHHLLGAVEVRSLNGIHVAWDFVELPSQIMENWCWERESLDIIASHYETGQPIPEQLLQKLRNTRTYMGAVAQMRQLYFAKMDLELHTQPQKYLGPDFDARIDDLMAPLQARRTVHVSHNLPGFSHLFADSTGYAAGYYSYKWAEVLDADAFSRFLNEGLLSETVGRELREKVLSRGNSAPPDALYRDFMGRDPSMQPLLERAGI